MDGTLDQPSDSDEAAATAKLTFLAAGAHPARVTGVVAKAGMLFVSVSRMISLVNTMFVVPVVDARSGHIRSWFPSAC